MNHLHIRFGSRALLAVIIAFALLAGGLAASKPARALEQIQPFFLGEIRLFPYATAPDGWMYCAGQTLPISTNTALFSLLGTNFGGDGKASFAIPDLRVEEPLDGVGYFMAMKGIFPPREGSSAMGVVGEVRLFPYSFTPAGWLAADGGLYAPGMYNALYASIGTAYGGNGDTTFAVPLIAPVMKGINYAIAPVGFSPQEGPGEAYLGEIMMLAYPAGFSGFPWPKAEGQELRINKNTALFSLLGNRFGGNGMTTFQLPNLTAVSPMYYINSAGIFPALTAGTPPTVVSDVYSVEQNGVLSVQAPGVLANDSNASIAIRTSEPEHGSLTLNANGSFQYTPFPSFFGQDRFTYRAGNETGSSLSETVTLSVYEPAPVITGVTDGGRYNEAKTIAFTGGSATLNGSPFTSGTTVSDEGDYTLVVSQLSGSATATAHFVIDKTPPVVSGVAEGGVYREARKITFNEGSALLDGDSFAAGGTVDAEGPHTLVVTDEAGNRVTIHFTIDTSMPFVIASSGLLANDAGGLVATAAVFMQEDYSGGGTVVFILHDGDETVDIRAYSYTDEEDGAYYTAFAGLDPTKTTYRVDIHVVDEYSPETIGADLAVPVQLAVASFLPLDDDGDGRIGVGEIVRFMTAATEAERDMNGDGAFDRRDVRALLHLIVAEHQN